MSSIGSELPCGNLKDKPSRNKLRGFCLRGNENFHPALISVLYIPQSLSFVDMFMGGAMTEMIKTVIYTGHILQKVLYKIFKN
jgi:hypothetical protein